MYENIARINLLKIDMKTVFPLWKQNTRNLAKGFIAKGFKAIITCVDSTVLDTSFAGRFFDNRFLSDPLFSFHLQLILVYLPIFVQVLLLKDGYSICWRGRNDSVKTCA